jgi:hypothetical protein
MSCLALEKISEICMMQVVGLKEENNATRLKEENNATKMTRIRNNI